MKKWITEIRALDPISGEMKTYGGDNVEAPTFQMAQNWCNENKGYLKVIGELIAEIPCKKGTYEADFSKIVV
jgi:hypothetical protein